MELIIQALMVFILINALLKLSFWKWWQTAVFSAVCAVFVIVSCRWAILQSKTQLADYLSNSEVMQNMAVLITWESMLHVAFCFVALRAIQTEIRRRLWGNFLQAYPGLLLFPVLFYLLTQLIYAFPGTGFTLISYGLAAAVAVALPLLSRAVYHFLPETELRLEVHFLVNLFVCVIGLITTVNGHVTYAAMEEPIHIKAIVLSVSLFLIAFVAGILSNKIKWILFNKKQKNPSN